MILNLFFFVKSINGEHSRRSAEPNTFEELVEKYKREYDWKYLKKFPELCEKKLRSGVESDRFNSLPEDALEDLPEINLRTRDQIINWILPLHEF